MKSKKSFFPFFYSFIIWFLFCFIFQINAFDSIKNIFTQTIETVKKGYNRLIGNNEKIPQIYKDKPILGKKNPEENSNPLDGATPIQTENAVNVDAQDILNDNKLEIKNTFSSKIPTSRISNNLNAKNIPYNEGEKENILNQYLELIKYNKSLNGQTIEKIKKTVLTKLEENPTYITIIEQNIKKQIKKITEKKLKPNFHRYKKNTVEIAAQKNSDIVTEEEQQNQKNSVEIELQTEIEKIEKKEKAQIEKLLLHDKKNKSQSQNPTLKNNEQKYKEKYFHLIQMIFQKHKNDIDAINKKSINNNNTNKQRNEI